MKVKVVKKGTINAKPSSFCPFEIDDGGLRSDPGDDAVTYPDELVGETVVGEEDDRSGHAREATGPAAGAASGSS